MLQKTNRRALWCVFVYPGAKGALGGVGGGPKVANRAGVAQKRHQRPRLHAHLGHAWGAPRAHTRARHALQKHIHLQTSGVCVRCVALRIASYTGAPLSRPPACVPKLVFTVAELYSASCSKRFITAHDKSTHLFLGRFYGFTVFAVMMVRV